VWGGYLWQALRTSRASVEEAKHTIDVCVTATNQRPLGGRVLIRKPPVASSRKWGENKVRVGLPQFGHGPAVQAVT
jgi:hypothetical protein